MADSDDADVQSINIGVRTQPERRQIDPCCPWRWIVKMRLSVTSAIGRLRKYLLSYLLTYLLIRVVPALLHSLVKCATVSSLSLHVLHLTSPSCLSIFTLMALVLNVWSCAAISNHSVSFFRWPYSLIRLSDDD